MLYFAPTVKWPLGLLFNRHRESRDQSSNLFEVVGIMFFDRLFQSTQAFLVAHGGLAGWNDRKPRP